MAPAGVLEKGDVFAEKLSMSIVCTVGKGNKKSHKKLEHFFSFLSLKSTSQPSAQNLWFQELESTSS